MSTIRKHRDDNNNSHRSKRRRIDHSNCDSEDETATPEQEPPNYPAMHLSIKRVHELIRESLSLQARGMTDKRPEAEKNAGDESALPEAIIPSSMCT